MPLNLFRSTLMGGLALSFTSAVAADPSSSAVIEFSQQIRPILSANCFGCHGPDAENRAADLRLDTKDGLFADRGGYRAVLPKHPDESELIRRVTATDPAERMPPADSNRQLTDEQIELLKQWIRQGAEWKSHWAFIAPTRPALPAVKQHQWVRNPIDRFVLARLESERVSPSPEADRRALIRRVAFDLTGLPPRPEEVEAFLADQSPDAYEIVLNRLLASKNYGEHRACYWLDLARYGDTHGLSLDNYREMWPYRDWVIRAFNDNLPYDHFLIDQLAGDLLPKSSLDQQIASGFLRNHVTTNEGGSIEEEVYVRNVSDCVSTVGTAMLGMTLGCAVCHDHKYDPVTQKDFYQLFAFFNSLDGPPMDGNVPDPAPRVQVPNEEQRATLDKLRADIAKSRRKCGERLDDVKATTATFEKWLQSSNESGWANTCASGLDITNGLIAQYEFEESTGEHTKNECDPTKQARLIADARRTNGRSGRAVEITQDGYVELGQQGRFKAQREFSYGAWLLLPEHGHGSVIAKTETKEGIKGYDLTVLADGRVSAMLSARWPGYAIKVITRTTTLNAGQWHHLFVTYDGSKLVQGVTLYVDGEPQDVDIVCDSLKWKGDIEIKGPLLLGRGDSEPALIGGTIDDVRLYDRRLTAAEAQAVFLCGQIGESFRPSRDSWTVEQLDSLRRLYVLRRDPEICEMCERIERLRTQLVHEELQTATTLVYRESRTPRPSFVLLRGQYDQHGDLAERVTPAFLPPMADDLPRDRLGLARWLVSPEHPLTTRVAVNQFWQQLFGTGLVKTSEDFGSQGSPPSHPELLDWLAVEFRESGWNVKALLKTIMMSATYRQSSRATPNLAERDPENRFLARGPRFRLDAEMIRDQALAISGLLVNRVGGPSVKPPQPPDLWKAVGYPESNTVNFVADEGPERVFRRSLYTFWKRTAPPPQLGIFDAPSRESCTARRERTNTPLQALLLMNEPQFLQAARHFAERILREAPQPAHERVAWAFERATMRPPESNEAAELLEAQRDFESAYNANPVAAQELIATTGPSGKHVVGDAELATWIMLANVILNLDEVLTKE